MLSRSLLTGFACGQTEGSRVSTSIEGFPQVLPGKVGVALSSLLLQAIAMGKELLQLPQAKDGMGVSEALGLRPPGLNSF